MNSFDRTDRFVVGTIGSPGEREFFLQIETNGQVFSFAIEKGQASALADRMKGLLRELRNREGLRWERMSPDDAPLKLPLDTDFMINEMSLVWESGLQAIIFEALGEDDSLRVNLTLQQCAEFVRRTEKVVAAGRTPCSFCGLPISMEGHLCPRANGYRR